MNTQGVSPVVGTVLLIAIMLITVSALMLWGVPAIQQMERRSQYRAVLSSFDVLDGLVDDVLPEEGSSRTGKIPLGGHGLRLEPQEDPFAVAWTPSSTDATFGDLGDDDKNVTFTTSASISECRFTHHGHDGTQTSQETPGPAASGRCEASENLTKTHRLDLRDGSTTVATVWVFHPGRVRYNAETEAGPFRLDYHNGAVSSDFRGSDWVVNDPLILVLEPEGLTVGLIDLNGTDDAAGGESTARVGATLQGTFVRTNAQTVHRVDLYPQGDMASGWRRFFNVTERYEFAHQSGDDHVRYEPGPTHPVTLTQYVVDLEMRGVGS